jgi:hypothetical protein
MLNPTLNDPACTRKGGSDDPKGSLMHPSERRGVDGSESPAPVSMTGIIGRSLDRLDVSGLVNAQDVVKFGERNRGEHLDVGVLK